MERYIREHNNDPRGRLGKVRKWLIGCLTPAFAVCLAVGLFLYFPVTSGVQSFAADATFNNIVNANIGLHPQWSQSKCDSVALGGVGDSYTVMHTVWHVDVKDNDPILEKSPAYTYQGSESVTAAFARQYNLKAGNEVVFNIEDEDTAAKVWADAVAFAQKLGPETELGDPSLAGTSPTTDCAGSSTAGADLDHYENHVGFRVGTNVNKRNIYRGNFFIPNEGAGLGQYITVRLQTDWTAKNISTTAPATITNVANTDYVTVSGNGTALTSTTFNYIKTSKQSANDNYLGADSITGYNRTQVSGDYTLSYDIASNGCDYDSGDRPVFNDNCAFSFGRINVPTGVYIVLDLNGHTIDRNLIGTAGDYFGSVFHISSKSRLEICDTSAYENASSLRISRYTKVAENSAGAVAVEGYENNKKVWKPIDATDMTTVPDLVVTNHKGTIKGGHIDTGKGASVLNTKLRPDMQYRGAGVNLSMWADLVVHSGTILGNENDSESGGAFYQRSKAAVTIFDGYVLHNVAHKGGGVSVLGGGSGCSFLMYGGVLGYNKAATYSGTASNGGAVSLGICSYANFHGGEMIYNHADGTGGALNVNGNTLGILDSVTITGNTANSGGGGIYVSKEVAAVDELMRIPNSQGHAFKFRGSLQVYGNKSKGVEQNVYLAYGTTTNFFPSGTGNGDKLTGYTGQPTIAIGGPLFKNGIVAHIGVTLGSVQNVTTTGSKKQDCSIFTSDYGKWNQNINANSYFFSDVATYSGITSARVVNTSTSSDVANEGRIANNTASEQSLVWIIRGTGITSTSENATIEITADSSETNYFDGKANGISYTYEGLTCEFGMLKATLVEAHVGSARGELVGQWKFEGGKLTDTFTKTQFRFKLGDEDIEGLERMQEVIAATDGSISYAGEYSFLVAPANGTRYKNPNFKIKINQTGVEVDRQLYYNGTIVTELGWTQDIDWDGNGVKDDYALHIYETNQPYFIYTGGYYYPILSIDYNRASMLSLYNPFDGKTSVIAKNNFTGYVLDFTYANTSYFGTSSETYAGSEVHKGKDVDFGEHSGGGIEYRTMHRQPGATMGIGTYVPGVMHAGTYQVSFISSRSAASADESNDDFKKTGVYFAANNFAFSSAVNIYVAPTGAEVQLTEGARNNFTYKGLEYTDREIVEFDNTSDTSVNPHTDNAASMVYYLFDNLKYQAGIYDIRTGIYYTLDDLATKKWEDIRPYGKDEESKAKSDPSRPYVPTLSSSDLTDAPFVKYNDGTEFKVKEDDGSDSENYKTYKGVLSGTTLESYEELYQKERHPESTGRLCYVIDAASSFTDETATYGQPTDARRYVVLVTLDLDVGYDDYDYEFDQDAEHLVGINGKSDYFWAFEFTIDPAEIDPYELLSGSAVPGGANTSVTLTKEHNFNNDPMQPDDKRLNLSVSYSSTVLEQEGDYTVELAPEKDYTNASVSSGDKTTYNLPLIIKFGGKNKNYVNKDATRTVATALEGSDAHEYAQDGGGYAFVVYFRIIPVEVTVSGSLSYTYDGRSYERARYLPPRDGKGEEDAWFESIFFLVQDNETTSIELINHQHDDHYPAGTSGNDDKLNDLWGGDDAKDIPRYKSRFTVTLPTVSYTDMGFMENELSLGIGLYAFNTGDPDSKSSAYHLTTVAYDGKGKTVESEGATRIEPTGTGVTWLISYKQTDGKQVQEFNTSRNFVISSTSFLDVTINQKNIGELAGDITKVGIQDFTHWKVGADKDNPAGNTLQAKDGSVVTGIEYPFAGDNWVYRPGVTIDYQPFYYAESVEHTTGRTEYGDELHLQGEDYTISYIANSSATGSNAAHIVLYGTGNYTGFLTLDFTITPAQIAVQYAGVGYVPQYDKTAHGVNVQYANVEDDATYQALADAGILVRSSGGGTFNPATDKPQPDAAVYTITYNARTRTADGFGGAADPEAITGTAVPIDAGVYDVKIVLGSANYQFVSGKDGGSYFTPVEEGDGYSNAATGSHTILPAVVSFEYTNSGEIYNRQTHTPQIKFTNITYQQHSDLRTLQNVVPLALGDDYEVEIAPVSSESYGENATDAGEYYVLVKLKSHNYCFDLELVKSSDLIIGYKDGATSEDNYPESRNDKAHTYSYSVHAESKDYTVDGTTAAVANFVIEKATITLDRFTDGTYNRTAQPQTPSFSNTERNNDAVPTHSGQNAGVSVTADEFTVSYTDENIISTTDSLVDNTPFYSDLYSVTITLTSAGEKNFKFETRTVTQPRFTHSETASATLLGQRLGEGEDDSVIIAPFLINRVDITITQRYASDVYNAKDHFADAEAAGFALETMDSLENWVSTMFQYSSSEAIQADDLTVEIEFSKKDGEPFATAYYYPNNEGNKVSFNGKEDYTFAEFAGQGQFTHVGEYEITVRFTDKSFYIANSGASNDGLTPSADFEYSITAAQISFSLAQFAFPYDAQAHQQTYPDGGVDLTNTRDAKVLPALAKGDVAGVGEVAVAYGYSGWAGSDVESSDGFKNVGTYTVTLTLQESGDFQFADGSYSLSRTYTIDAMDISLPENFGDAVFTPDELAGHKDYKIPAYHYTGAEIEPEITLTDEKGYSITLKTTEEGCGLQVAYTLNVNAGPATATLTGVNNFTGTRAETFYVLPAIVSITASDSSSHSETFDPNSEPQKEDGGSLTFSYNKTLQFLTYTFENLCGSAGTTPTSADYTVKYYKADDWDKVANKPNDGAVPLEAEGITDSGDYYVWFEFVKGTKERSNFVFYKEDSAADEPTGMFDLSNPHLFAYGFQVTVTPAEIQINLADQFKGEGGFVNEFDFNRQNWATTLNSAQLTGTNGVVPTSSDYEIFFSTDGTDSTRTETARDAGNYYLVFKLTDTAGNYVVSGVYAGTGDGAVQLNPVEKGGEGYHAEDGDNKNISVFFTVKKAKIEVYLSNSFKSESAFNNSFGYNRSDWQTRLNPVTFKNELSGGVVPSTVNVDYQVTFLKGADATSDVLNAGSYTLKFTLDGDDAQNFVITHVRAGSDADYVELAKTTNYTTTDDGDMRAFDVGFTITPADIEIHLADRFKSEGAFVNSFVYTRSNLYSVLSVISIKNADNVIPLGTDYTVSFKTELTGEDTTDIANVGKYYLVFKLSDDVAGNYNVTGIYAGDGVDASVPTASGEDDKGYHGDKKSFSVKFDITPAQIEVYLSEDFRSGSDFINEFGFNKSDRANALNSVQFKNELRNGIFPQNGEYSVALKSVGKDTETDTTAVRNVGSYKLVIALTEATKKNFEITAVYAGAPSATAGSGDAVELNAVSKDDDKGYVKIGDEDALRSFSVAFTVIPAEIQVHVPEQFRNGDLFVNQFGFNKSSWATMLNGVTLSGKDDIVPTNNEYSVTFMLKDKDTVSDATDVGDYRLVFTLTDDAGNYVITAIYAGKDDTFDVKKKAGEAYQPLEGTLADRNLKKFSLAFSVTPAVLDLYLNAFRAGDAFTNSFVFDGTDQSVKLGFIELKNEGNIVPVAEAYEVSFFYNSDSEKGAADGVYDVGAYTLYFKFTALAGNNYVLRNIYAGSGSTKPEVSLTEDNYRDKTESEVYVDFTLTPATIDVYFSAGILKDGGTYVNKFYYDRNDWKTRFGMVYLDNTMEGNSAVPSGTQYSIEFYKCDSLTPEKETWGDTAVKEAITDIGRYSVTFRLSKELTGHYPGVKHYNNYTIGQVRVGGASEGDSVPLDQIDLDRDPTGADGYRVSKNAADRVYITLVFDIMPNVVKLEKISDKIFNDDAQDAGFTFSIVDSQGVVTPEAAHGDFALTYVVDEGNKTTNERMKDGKPYFAGAYTVSIELSDNFVFDTPDGERTTSGNFKITPVVLSAYLGYTEGDGITEGSSSLPYDGLAHEYQIFTKTTAADIPLRNDGDGKNVYQVSEATYTGWAGNTIDDSDGYKNAGTYTLTLSFYIFSEDGTSTNKLGGNFSFGGESYTISLTYAIQQRTITDGDVYGIENGEHKVYNGKPQTNGIEVRMTLVEGKGETMLTLYDNDTKEGDYSISNTSDINVGAVSTTVNGMHNFQGSVDLSYYIDPAEVTATIDKTSLPYNAQDQSRSFTFKNESGTDIVPAYNTNENVSDYVIKYTFYGEGVSAPHNAGEYTVTVTLHNLTGVGEQPNFKFKDGFAGRTDDHTATFTFTITKAEIYLAAIPDASYTGEARDATVTFVNEANAAVLPKDYTVTYDGEETVPTHVKTNGSRTPVAYDVKVTLKDVSGEVTGTQRDLSNFKFVTHESATYTFDTDKGVWGQEAYKITPAIITGSLSVTIDDEPKNTTSNVYDTKKHIVSVAFRNAEAGFTVIPEGTMGDAAITGLVATYEVKDGETLLYTLKVTFTPNWVGFSTMTFDGIPENAGTYVISVDLVSADFLFATDGSHADWTYTIANAKIKNAESLGDEENSTTFTRSRVFAPDNSHDITLKADDFKFIDKENGFNASHATFAFTSCTGAAFDTVADENGLTIGYRLKGAGLYTIAVTVDAPNHDPWAITLKVTVNATAIELTVLPEAKFSAVYGEQDAYLSKTVLEQVLKFIREGKITVDGISGSPEEKADALVSYGFGIGILALDSDYSGANRLKVGDYGLKIDKMEVSGFEQESFIVFKDGGTEYNGKVFTVTPLAITISTKDAINDLRYNGYSLVNEAASDVVISNLLDGDVVDFESVRYRLSEGGNFNNGSVFETTDAVHVGKYWVHVFSSSDNGLNGADAGNYFIEEKDENSTSIRYMGQKGVYVAFEIKRREVELAIADSTSVYGDADAVYGAEGTKKFNFSYTDPVLTEDFGRGDKATQLNQFVLDLLALFNSEGTSKLAQSETPYPGAGSYIVKLDPDAGNGKDWVLGEGRFNFDDDFILHIDDRTQSGRHTIEKRSMRVRVHDYSSYYGEDLKESGFEGSEGAWGFTPLDEFVNGDNAEALAITITLNELAFTAQGKKYGQWWGAMTYVGGLTPVSASTNYSVTFSEGTGNYTVMRRPIVVLIGSQTTVYGEPILKEFSSGSLDSNWAVYGTTNEQNMGYANGDTRSGLQITLTLDSVVNETASAGVYPNVIKGSCGNSNYDVTFKNWVVKDGKNEPGDHEGGDYEITRRSVAVRIGSSTAIYGTDGIRVGSKIELTAPDYTDKNLNNRDQAQWTYDFDKADYTILTQDLGYLTFYLGKADPANAEKLYATVGTHAIVGVWGFGYDKEMTFMKSYDVQFFGEWEGSGAADPNYHTAGVFTVTPADIQRNPDIIWEASNLYRQYKEGDKTPATGWYALQIAANYLIYAGDYTDASGGKLEFAPDFSDETKLVYYVKVGDAVRATITYSKPTNTTQIEQEVEEIDNLWNIHSVGIWHMQVTVEAANHNPANFTYIYEIEAVVAKVMLNMNEPALKAVYGDYEYILPGAADYETKLKELPLTSVLHDYLEQAIMYVDGLAEAYPGTGFTDWIDMVLEYCRVEVIKAKVSTSGMLEAGRYHLRIVAESGCGFTVAFVDGVPDDGVVDYSGYDRLIIEQKELGIDWIGTNEPEPNESRPELRGSSIIYTYSSYNYHFDPLFTDVIESELGKDLVNQPIYNFYDAEGVLCENISDVGTYRIVINGALFGGDDASNYKLPEQLEIEVRILPMEVKVTLFDRGITYGDDLPGIVTPAANGDGTVTPSPSWTCDRLGVNDDARKLGVKVTYLDAAGREVQYNSAAGVYRIVGSAPDSNYHVTFVNASEDGDEAVLTIRRAHLTVTIESIKSGVIYGDKDHPLTFAVTPQEGDDEIAWWDLDRDTKDLLGIALTLDDTRDVGSYSIRGSWTNKNYNVVFAGDWEGDLPADYLREADSGEPLDLKQGAGTYVIAPRPIRLTLPETMQSIYGEFSTDGRLGTQKFSDYILTLVQLEAGQSFAYDEDISDLHLSWTLPEEDAARYEVFAVEDNDPNYDIDFGGHVLVWTVTARTVTVTIHTQHSEYGDTLVALDGSDLTFWTAENLAEWHQANAYGALGIELAYAGVTDRSNAGTYEGAIRATQTANLDNYTLVFHNDGGEAAYGTYIVDQRAITLEIGDFESTFGDYYDEDDFNALIVGGYTLAEGSTLASWDAEDSDFVLGTVLTKSAGYHANVYPIFGADTDDNYAIEFVPGTFTIHRATNEWLKHFSLESMNEGETPDEELLSAAAKFGTVTVKYYYDELCTSEVTGELSSLPKSTYYAKITVDGTNNYSGLEEVKEFVVNDSFLVVNGGLDVTLFVCIFASQFIILTFALIFIRRKKAKNNEPKEMK